MKHTVTTAIICVLLAGCSSPSDVPIPPELPCREQLISGFERLEEWQLIGAQGSAVLEALAAEGSASLRMTTGHSGVVAVNHTLPSPLDLSARALSLMVFSDNPLAISSLEIGLTVRRSAGNVLELRYSLSDEGERQFDRWDAHVWTSLALNPMRTSPNNLEFLNHVEAITLWLHSYAPNTFVLMDALKYVPRRSDQRIVTIAVDDGHYSSATQILPVLKTDNFTATAFITPRTIGTDRLHLSQTQLELLIAAGWEIGGHDDGFLSSLSLAELETRLDGVVAGLTALGVYSSTTSFAYPRGDYRTLVGLQGSFIREATLARFASARSIKNGINVVGAEDTGALLTLLRLPDSLVPKKLTMKMNPLEPQNQSYFLTRLDEMSPGDYAIITYHRVVEPGQAKYETEIELTAFKEDMTHLLTLERDKGYLVITLGRFLQAREAAKQDGVCFIDKYLEKSD